MQELRAGACTPAQVDVLERGVFEPFERRGRVLTPSARAFKECGRVLADLSVKDGIDLRTVRRSLSNDVLLATSCRETGATLVTRDRDFARIARHLAAFRHVAPWPGLDAVP